MVNLPKELEAALSAQFGVSYNTWVASLQQPPPTSIRINPLKQIPDNRLLPVPWCETGIYLPERPSFTFDPHFHAGAYYVQEASSMFLEQAMIQLADITKPLNVLDLSAAPGGKSTHILTLLNAESLLVSNEVIRSRAGILAENIQKWGHSNVVVTNNDPKDFTPFQGFFDVIIVDAPCSGEGLFRKDPLAINQWSSENVALCAKRQQRILHDVWPALKQDGLMIYSTCTYNKIENESNLLNFAKEHNIEFREIKTDNEWNVEEVKQQALTGYRFYPHRVAGEGFFLSAFTKKEKEDEIRLRNNKTMFASPSKKILHETQHWIHNSATKTHIQRNDLVQFLPAAKQQEIELLAKHLYILSAGTNVCTVKHDKLIPEHALALSVELNKQHFSSISVTLDDALKYLSKDVLQLHTESKGFASVTYKQLPLGWINALPNRVNNLYPAEWRIRSSRAPKET